MQAGAHDAIEATEPLDDHRVLLLHHEERVRKDRDDEQDEDDEAEQASKQVKKHR